MKVFLALPVLHEANNLPGLLDSLAYQSFQNFELFVCVNQPDHWWNDENRKHICEDNQLALQLLRKWKKFPVHILDRSSRGDGWKGKHFGVGWARKTAMDAIHTFAHANDILVSIDADTFYPENYLKSILTSFAQNPEAMGLANPYYHKLTGDQPTDRAILRYEIYMRNYNLNMMMIDNPYAFTALGSAIAVPVWAYRKVNGITPHKSGEDFYFLQKLKKSGELLIYNNVLVYPSARKSDRVFFGTGPAIIKGAAGNWSSYPVYHHELFKDVRLTYEAFADMYKEDISTPLIDFLKYFLKETNLLEPLRKNASNAQSFTAACIRKVDALRILQFLKHQEKKGDYNDETSLLENFKYMGIPSSERIKKRLMNNRFQDLSTEELLEVRDLIFDLEVQFQRKIYILQ